MDKFHPFDVRRLKPELTKIIIFLCGNSAKLDFKKEM